MIAARPRVAFAMAPEVRQRIFPDARMARFEEIADVLGSLSEFESDAARRMLAETDVLVTGWGAPFVDAAVLDAAPRLKAVLHSAGTIRPFLSDDVLERGIRVSTAAAANAVPVAEYTAAMIVLANKKVLPIAARYRALREEFDAEAAFPGMGNYGKRIGIVGASKIGRKVIELLRAYELDVVVYDPFLSQDDAAELGVGVVGLDELLSTSDVVSVHAPSLPATRNLIDARGIGLMRVGSTLLNTARGEIIDQDALTARVLAGELFAILDVTTPWVLATDHPLYAHEHVMLTPHVAGSLGVELGRLADVVHDELERLIDGRALAHEVEADRLSITA
ncbi:hydroxyacid dehydrogenase [Agromyces cerinus]|uniref:Phosphoglycerate dehydrogenase n=1 Tax=Agromyces cerinus subsp. cerinus TaxID=232089 RepID=A0A1N6I206_9MICO|nr:hydroxyacid dehydrogenase [Agromyces cerinus]SIO26062.1 Phosphoglycerate dehydrogenase [Agromyces cerinus subsp. cerinus]